MTVLCGTDESFPLQLWCQILWHAEHQLNTLHKSRLNPTVSAFEEMYGPHDYDTHPFAILGCAVELHVMPKNRKTWETHTKTGYYLGASWDHFWCHRIWVKDTKSERVGQTVFLMCYCVHARTFARRCQTQRQLPRRPEQQWMY